MLQRCRHGIISWDGAKAVTCVPCEKGVGLRKQGSPCQRWGQMGLAEGTHNRPEGTQKCPELYPVASVPVGILPIQPLRSPYAKPASKGRFPPLWTVLHERTEHTVSELAKPVPAGTWFRRKRLRSKSQRWLCDTKSFVTFFFVERRVWLKEAKLPSKLHLSV